MTPPPDEPRVVYRVDAADRIVSVNDAWRSFATANDGAGLADPLGQSLWQHIGDQGSRDLYSLLFTSVRVSGRSLSYPYRCDSPTLRRLMDMSIEPGDEGSLVFSSRIVSTEPMPHAVMFGQSLPYSLGRVDVCGNCRKVRDRNGWTDIMELFNRGQITAQRNSFTTMYRICPACRTSLRQQANDLLQSSRASMDRVKDILARYHAQFG